MRLRPVLLRRETTDWWDEMRIIRNACVVGFTHSTWKITQIEQENYRLSHGEYVRHYVYLNEEGDPVAFSRLDAREDGFVYPTYGVDPAYRGKGYAWEVVKHAMLAAGGPLRGDLLDSNEAIKKVDFALGWRPQGPPPDENGVLLVEADWPPAFIKELL